jgi:hypothetical protein
MQRVEVSGAVRHIYIYIYIYMSLGVKGLNTRVPFIVSQSMATFTHSQNEPAGHPVTDAAETDMLYFVPYMVLHHAMKMVELYPST